MNPYAFLEEIVTPETTVLSLCSGIGIELSSLRAKSITAVDIAPQYIDELKKRLPEVKTVVADALGYIKQAKGKSVDVISLYDAVEHLTKEDSTELIKQCKRVARRHVLIFTPEGYVRNEPHDAWGIEGADHWQQHLCGWTMEELRELGFVILHRQPGTTQHGDEYHSLMARWDRV